MSDPFQTSARREFVGATADDEGDDPPRQQSRSDRHHFLTSFDWAGCLRNKALHCWTIMFSTRKKGKITFFLFFFC